MRSKTKPSPSDLRHKQRSYEERQRGIAESKLAIEMLQALLPAAFPKDFREIKPLLPAVTAKVAAVAGWRSSYASGVLFAWKCRVSYRAAVLRGTFYYDLDGRETEIAIDEAAREWVRNQGQRRDAKPLISVR